MFHDGDLQSGIALAVQTQKAVLCFVHDDTDTSSDWERTLSDGQITQTVKAQTVALKLRAGSQEAGFLSGICPLNSIPAIVVIRNAGVEANLQSNQVPTEELKSRLNAFLDSTEQPQTSTYSTSEPSAAPQEESTDELNGEGGSSKSSGSNLGYLDLQASSGRFRLPNNAYDALRSHTQTLIDDNQSPQQILESQVALLERLPIFRDEAQRIRSGNRATQPILSDTARDRLLRLPAAAIKAQPRPTGDSGGEPVYTNQPNTSRAAHTSDHRTPQQPPQPSTNDVETQQNPDPPGYSTYQHHAQREDYIRLQKQREQSQRDERERIKAQIKADREERRRKEEVRKQNETAADADTATITSSLAKPKSNDVRIQVRTFDGSTIRNTFKPGSSITSDIRPWIDESTGSNVPYNLKLVLTPLPNRNIEASEEEHSLSDLGIKGSGTLVMVPVKGYVESYTGSTPTGLIGSAVSGGYNLVTGTAGTLFGGVKSMLGYGGQQEQKAAEVEQTNAGRREQGPGQRQVRVRTLADQRAEEGGRDHQFYNGNQLNFEPNRDDDEARKND